MSKRRILKAVLIRQPVQTKHLDAGKYRNKKTNREAKRSEEY
jgi:hypothetical protein